MAAIKLLLSIIIFSVANLVCAQGLINKEHIHEDFRILKTTLEEMHPDLYRYTGKNEFDAKADSILRSLQTDYDPIQLYLKLSPLVTQIKNGHTSIKPPKRIIDSLSVLPFRLIAFEGKVYVNKYLGSLPDMSLVGCEVRTINEIPIEEIVSKSLQFVSVDGFNNSARFKAVVEDDLALFYALIYGRSKKYKIQFATHNGLLMEGKEFNAITYQEFLERYDQKEEFPLSIKRLDSSGTALLAIRSFNNVFLSDGRKLYFNKIIDDLFRDINRWGIERLILDIRFNGGGELKNSMLLYSYLANAPFQFTKHLEMSSISPPTYLRFTNYEKALKYAPINRKRVLKKSDGVFEVFGHFSQNLQVLKQNHFKGKLIVLINGNTASAAGALASCVKNDKRGLIVGEENRDNYTGFSAGVPVILTLPHSGITVSIPIRKFTYADGQDNGRGVMPDYFYASTAKNFFSAKEEQLIFLNELFEK